MIGHTDIMLTPTAITNLATDITIVQTLLLGYSHWNSRKKLPIIFNTYNFDAIPCL